MPLGTNKGSDRIYVQGGIFVRGGPKFLVPPLAEAQNFRCLPLAEALNFRSPPLSRMFNLKNKMPQNPLK